MIKYQGCQLGMDSDLYDEFFYVAAEVEDEFRALNNEIRLLKELLRESNTELFYEQMRCD